jgi:potassium large conductance calcium-activated channel subfamily M alpha protein 1
LIYRKFNIILFGLDIPREEHEDDHDEVFRDVLLYPRGRIITSSDVGLVIAKNLQAAEQISKLDLIMHPRCLGLRKLYCAACIMCGMSTLPRPEELRELLRLVKEGNSSDVRSNDELHFTHEHKIAIIDEEKDAQHDGSFSKEARKLESSTSRHHGLTSHSCLVKGDIDGSSHGKHRREGIISQVSLGKTSELQDITEHMAKPDTKTASKAPKALKPLEIPRSPRDSNHHASFPDGKTPDTPRKVVISLEDAIDLAMCWPPLHQFDKPDPAILERRAAEIAENLQRRTMNIVVKLHTPHILVCIQGKWPSSLFYFFSHLRTPGLPNPPIVILHPNVPAATEWGTVGFFEEVYFVKGSPRYELDLVRAGILQAEKVVILTQGIQLEESSGELANDEQRLMPSNGFTLDVNNVFIAATVSYFSHPKLP